MNKSLIKLLCAFIIVLAATFSASAQVYVKIRPSIPVIVRPQQPSPRHVWINEEWEPNGGGYRYAGGHWAAPPHPGYRWRGGYWRRHNRDGEQWVRGGWRRR